MEILVCAKRVPDTAENEIQLNAAGTDIERDDLVYSVNEADNYAVEEALQIVARTGGNVTVVTVGGEEDEEVLRREMAMGANRGVLISDDTFNGSDGRGTAAILKAYVQTEHYDLILSGAPASCSSAPTAREKPRQSPSDRTTSSGRRVRARRGWRAAARRSSTK